jgi:dimethylglycine dehydrogenase
MKTHVQVAVIGGGVVGCSVLYHLTKFGWKDVVLLEREELTCGSTWHAAGGMHTLNGDPDVAKLQKYTIELYKEIEEASGLSCSLHLPGGLMLADTPERMDWLRMAEARGRYLGLESELISIEEAAKLMPLIDTKHFIGALWDPMEGHCDPSGTTNAYAKAATIQGAEVYRKTKVEELRQRSDGSWDVVTNQGTIVAEHVINCGGLWAREVGRMVGLELPVLAMEHHYLVTEDVSHLFTTGKEFPHCIDFAAEIYLRQEQRGMLLGTYEHDGVPWSPKSTPWNFAAELLQPDLDRIATNLELGFQHFPALADAGIKRVVNGPFTFTPDGNPLVGPVRGLRNYWVACGVMAGFSQGGGVGLTLANWMINGDPGGDIWAMDVARFGDWATLAYTNAKVRETYARRFRVSFPNEELPAARPLRTTPIYPRLKDANAVFGAAFGLEWPLWFAPAGTEPVETVTFRRSNAHDPIAAECRAVRTAVGMLETSGYAKYEFSGPGAEAFLSSLLTNRMPETGRIVLAPMLNPQGKLIGDFTVARLNADTFHVFGSGPAEQYHMRWFEAHAPSSGVTIRSLRTQLMGLSIAGPHARALLAKISGEDVSTAAFPFMSYRRMDLGMIPALVGRITFTGDLGYEIWVSPDYQLGLYDLLVAEGAEFGLAHFGIRALESLRLEKSWGIWAREYRPVYGPFEAGLGRFVSFKKGDFVGRDAALREREEGGALRLVTLRVEEFGADVVGDEPVAIDGKTVGWVTSGGYAHWSGASLAMAYIPAEHAQRNDAFAIEVLGAPRRAVIAPEPVFDPAGTRMRG